MLTLMMNKGLFMTKELIQPILLISMILVMFFSYLQKNNIEKNNIEKNIKIEIKEN